MFRQQPFAAAASNGPLTPVSAGAPEEPALTSRLLGIAALIELFLLALVAVAPLGGISQTISPLARQWPWLLVPARLIFGNALVDGSVPPAQGWPALLLFATLLIGVSCQAALVIPVCRRFPSSGRRYLIVALGAAAVFGLTLVLLPTLPSDDIFSYILYGRIGAIHHANPLIVAPSSFPGDPFLRLVFWQGTRSVYGPAWLLLSQWLTLLADALGGSLARYVLLFKLLGLCAHLANAVLIWFIVGRLAPHRQLLATLFYAWNPLCLVEFCASAHNDAVMLTFLLLGIYCVLRGWEVVAMISFGVSISVKYVLLALLPLYFVLVIRQTLESGGTRRLAALRVSWRVLAVSGTVALTLLPYWAGPKTLSAILYSPPAEQLDNSLLEAVSWPLRSLIQALGVPGGSAAAVTVSGLKVAGLVVFLAIWLVQLWRVRSLETLLYAWIWVLLGYLLVASGWYWPWYATWAVALVALVAGFDIKDDTSSTSADYLAGIGTATLATLLLAGGSLVLYGFLPLYSTPIYGYRALVALGPAAIYLLIRGWRCRTDQGSYRQETAPAAKNSE
ncbi:MAG: hypothetical protein ACLQUY_03770 [Ktedonobacterales bacterium]